jgi:DNA-binding NarL/FixJ family response regulator
LSSDDVAVLVVEDDAMVRGWVRLSLKGEGYGIVGEAATPEEAVELVERRGPQVLLVDFHLGRASGTKLVRDLRERGVTVPIILMTANAQAGFNEAADEAGAQGTFLKTGSVDELLATLASVLEGRRAFDPRHPQRPPGRAALSPREREVLRLVASGSTNREIALTLEVGEEAVQTLVAQTFAKLGVRRPAEAVREAHWLGLL